MTINYINLPGARTPQSAFLDFTPLNQGIDSARHWSQQQHNAMLADKQNVRAEQANSRAAQGHSNSQTEFQQGQDDRLVKQVGRRAMAAYQEKDPARKAALWHPFSSKMDRSKYGPEWLDPNTGPQLALAEAGMLPDPLEQQERQARLGLVEAQTTNARGEAGERSRKAAFDQQIVGMLGGADQPPVGQTNAAPSGFQPQSYQGGDRGAFVSPETGQWTSGGPQAVTRPGMILAADDMPYAQPGQPTPPAQVPRPATPGAMDGMSAQQRAAFGLAMSGRGDAGKILLDSSQANLQKPTVNAIEERTLNSATQLGRLGDIKKQFDPAFLEIPKRMQLLGQSWSAKFGGKLSLPQRQELSRYARFRSASVNNLNTILKELSGAAVTPQEYERIQNDAPVAGTGVFDGDDPVSFQAKLERTEQNLKAAIARMNFVKSRGLNFSRDDLDMFMSLDDVPAAYDKRGSEIEAELRRRNPQIEPQALEEATSAQLKREWGI